VGGERTVEDLEEDEMEEAEKNYGSEGEELKHGASSDEGMVRVIREKANGEIKKLKQKSGGKKQCHYLCSFFIVANI